MSRTMHLTADYLRQDHGFEVYQLFMGNFRWSTRGGAARFLQPWEAGLIVQRTVKELGGFDVVEAHEPLALGCGIVRRLRRAPWRLVAFSYGLEQRGIAAMLDYRRTHSIPVRVKSRVGCWLQTCQSSAGLRLADHVICSNLDDARYLVNRGFAPDRVSRHFSGVDTALLERGRTADVMRPPNVLFVGSWIERKGILEIAAALARVLNARPDTYATVAGCQVPVGDVLSAFPEAVRGRVRAIRHLESEEALAAVYASHRVFVLPSYFEGQPLVMMEAAAFGLAIVTTPICGMLDFIRDGENGLFAPVGDAAALANQIQKVLDDPELAASLGVAARKDAERHTWRESARNLAEIYRKVAARVPT